MKKNIPVIAIVCVLALGVCVLLYPVVSAIIAKMTESVTISSYQKAVENLSGQQIAKMKADAEKYNRQLSGAVLSDPFTGTEKLDTGYIKLLNVSEVMGYLEIPKINVYLPIYHGTSAEVLQKGIGHLQNTSLPIGGKSTHAVLSGHRGLPSATLLTNLDQMKKGDVFYIHILDEILAYQVEKIKVVNPDNTADLAIQPGRDLVTLVTCTPYGINTQRLLVRGKRIEYIPGSRAQPKRPSAALAAAAVPAVLLVRAWKKRRRVRK